MPGAAAQVHGDAWLARIFDNEDAFQRLDFHLAEVSSSAAWVQTARAQRLAKAGSKPAAQAFRELTSQADSGAGTPAPRRIDSAGPPGPAEAARVRASCFM